MLRFLSFDISSGELKYSCRIGYKYAFDLDNIPSKEIKNLSYNVEGPISEPIMNNFLKDIHGNY